MQGIEDRRVVSIIGDGSLTGGMAFEGLNNLGHSDTRSIIILNDNGRSYAPTVSKLSDSLGRLRLHPSYVRNRARLDRILHEVPLVGEHLERGVEGALAALREMFEPPAFFEMLGVRYTGPFDGHDIAGLESALRNAGEYDGPIVVHVLTQKGRGYAPAETDPIKRLHDLSDAKPGSYTAAFTEAVIKEAEHRPELVAITAAMPDSTGLLPFKERFPDRFFDVGIAEQHAVTAAAGMAMGGLRPVVAIYSTFLVAGLRPGQPGRGPARPARGVLPRPGRHHRRRRRQPPRRARHGAAVQGAGHDHLRPVLVPRAGRDAARRPRAVHRRPRRRSASPRRCRPRRPRATRWARGCRPARCGPGGDVCLLAVGKMLAAAREAAEALAAEGVEASVWDVRVAKPLDEEMLADAARHPAVVTMEDGYREGGIGAAIAGRLGVLAPSGAVPRVAVLGVPVQFIQHGKPDAILASLGLDAAGVARAARDLLA